MGEKEMMQVQESEIDTEQSDFSSGKDSGVPQLPASNNFYHLSSSSSVGHNNIINNNMDLRDSRDEDSFDDPYIYSDDSASLSDAYFFPQPGDDLARPRRYREEDPLTAGHQYPVASYYGSLSGTPSASATDRSSSPLWVAGAIQEDSELVPPATAQGEHFGSRSNSNSSGQQRGRESTKRRQRRQHRLLQHKQRERAARERAVALVRGKPQQVTTWQDSIFAIIFVVQLMAIIACAVRFGYVFFQHDPSLFRSIFPANPEGRFHWQRGGVKSLFDSRHMELVDDDLMEPSSSSEPLWLPTAVGEHTFTNSSFYTSGSSNSFAFTIDYKNIVALVGVAGFYACVLTYLSFGFMLILSRALIQIMLVFSVLLALAWGVIGLTLDPYGIISFMGFASLLLTLGYTIASWNRIPFAATNLYTALCAMRCTADITILGLVSLLVAFAWCVIWTMAFVGIVNSFNSAECTKKDACEAHVTTGHMPVYLVLLFSFHWTNTVIKNVVRATVASAIGTWWFHPTEIGPFCTNAVIHPLFRSLTKSLGSICLGSLVVQPAQTLSGLAQCCCCLLGCQDGNKPCGHPIQPPSAIARGGKSGVVAVVDGTDDDDEESASAAQSVGLCQKPCCNSRCGSRLRFCNRWSFTYIGMYGYSFAEAGERAFQLFETREWLDVVKDNLVPNVLVMASIIIGGSTGTFAVVVEETDGYDFTSFHKPVISAFLVGSVIGYVLSNILLLGVVESAVNTVLVCFAAGPFEFDKNHSRLSREMREAWSHHVWETSS